MSPVPTRIRVLVVDDSAVVRGILGRAVDAEADMHVVTTATNGEAALDALRHTPVDIVLLDIEMPVMDGLTALPLIVERHPDVRVIVTSALTREGATTTMRALALGAVDYVHKPAARDGILGVQAAAAQIVSRVRAIGHATRNAPAAGGTRPRAADMASVARPLVEHPPGGVPRVIALAASTGGPNALATVVRALPADFPLPVLVTQHMPPIFTAMFAQRLAREGSLPCEEGRDGESVLPGRVYVAPGANHMTVVAGAAGVRIRLTQDEPEHHCRPAADPMLRSVAAAYGNGAVAVVMTGMGEDGAAGAGQIAAVGGRVLVQDEASSVVWGMPGSVVAAGVPCNVVPLGAIASHLLALTAAHA